MTQLTFTRKHLQQKPTAFHALPVVVDFVSMLRVFIVSAIAIQLPAVAKIKHASFAARYMWRARKKRGRWLG